MKIIKIEDYRKSKKPSLCSLLGGYFGPILKKIAKPKKAKILPFKEK